MIPLSASDLQEIAKALEPIELLPAITQNTLIGRIEVYRPEGDEIVGHFERAEGFDIEDSWFGFVPKSSDHGDGRG